MGNYLKYFSEPAFVVGVITSVIVGIILILLTPTINKIRARFLQSRNKNILQRQYKKRQEVISLQRDSEKRNSIKLDSLYNLLLATCLLILGIVLIQLLDPILTLLNSTNILKVIGFETIYFLLWIVALFILTRGIIKLSRGVYLREITDIAERREKLLQSYSMPTTPKVNVIKAFLDPAFKSALASFDQKEFGLLPEDEQKSNETNPPDDE